MSKVRRKHATQVPYPPVKDVYNPFSDQSQTTYRDGSVKKSTKQSKKVGKCFQLVLICQKLLKPFSSTNKTSQPNVTKQSIPCKEKPKSIQDINAINRLPDQTIVVKPGKVDVSVQTNRESYPDLSQLAFEDGYDTNQGSEDFPYDVDESLKESYWDLDIDSAIVGDFNSMSALSLDEQIDPHYATIKVTADGKVIDKPQCDTSPNCFESQYRNEKISYPNSCTSSPKSGVYSKIIKPGKPSDFNLLTSTYFRLNTGSRLNFERIISIRNQLGRSVDLNRSYVSSESSVYPSDAPDIPLRNYGSSVINYVTMLQQQDSISHSCISSSMVHQDQKLSSSNLYSPIWFTNHSPAEQISHCLVTPASEPVIPKRSINKILHHLNPTYHDDSSEDASVISTTSPAKTKYSYPSNFCDNRYRHADTDELVDMNTFVMDRDRLKPFSYHHRDRVINVTDIVTDVCVPLDSDGQLTCDDCTCLQPLMERSCEEEYFKRDLLSSLDYINV